MKSELNSINNAPDITMTEEYLVLKGRHIRIKNGYFYKQDNAVSIPVKDILSIEKVTMRSKRLLMICLISFSLISVIFGLQKTFGAPIAKTVDGINTVNGILSGDENTYKGVAEEIFDEIVEGNEIYDTVKKAKDYYDKGSSAVDDIDKLASGDITPIIKKAGGNFIAFIYSMLFIISSLCLAGYIFRPYYLLRVSALGNDIAVNANSYKKDNLSAFINIFYANKDKK